MDMFNRGLSEQRDEAGMAARLNALGGMTGLYGTTPALINTFGNQLLASQGNLLQGNQLQQGLGQGLINSQINKSAIPGDFQQAMGNIGSVLGMAGRIGGAFTGIGSIPGLGGMFGRGMPTTSIANPANTAIAPAYRGIRF